MQLHCFRLVRGDDLLESLSRYCKEKDIQAAVLLSSVGCVSKCRLRDASGVTIHEITEPLELLSLNGTLSACRIHLHAAFSREDLSVIGGHLLSGTIVNTTCEVVLCALQDTAFLGEYDPATGYEELLIR